MYPIEPIFLIFPLICLFLSGCCKNNNFAIFILTILFILLFSFSQNGADYYGYQSLYKALKLDYSITDIHGEIGFNLIMKFFATSGVDYYFFRIVLLTVTTLVLFFSIKKMSPNFYFSIFLLFSMFIIYMISAYRQFIVMSFSFPLIYKYKVKNEKLFAMFLSLFMILVHISAIIFVAYLFLDYAIIRYMNPISQKRIFKYLVISILIFFVLRIIILQVLKVHFFSNIVSILFGGVYLSTSIFTIGLLSRISILLIMAWQYSKSRKNKLISFIFLYYVLSILLYIACPYELFVARLTNNAKIFEIILIPLIAWNYLQTKEKMNGVMIIENQKYRKINHKLYFIAICMIAIVILINQLLVQEGYFPYVNPIFGIYLEV